MNQPVFPEKSLQMAKSYLMRARNKLQEAEILLREGHYPESVSASQECIELSMKSTFYILIGDSPKEHTFRREVFEKVIVKVPEELRHLIYSKLYFYDSFWSSFYTIAKYGLEDLKIGPEKLFEKEEAQLSLKHADICRFAAKQLENYVNSQLANWKQGRQQQNPRAVAQ